MTFQELDNLLGLSDLTVFTNRLTKNGCQVVTLLQQTGTRFLLDDDKWKYWGLNWSWDIWENITAAVKNIQSNLQDLWRKLCDTWDSVWLMVREFWWYWLKDKLWRIRDIFNAVSWEFDRFLGDPWGYLWRVIQAAVSPLISGIKAIGIDIWDFVLKVRSAVSEVVSSFVDSAKNTIVNWITNRIDDVKGFLNFIYNWVSEQLKKMWEGVLFIKENFPVGYNNITRDISNKLDASTSSILKTIDFGLGGLADAFYKAITGIFGPFWDWFKEVVIKAWNFVNKNFLMPLKAGAEEVMAWLWELIQGQIRQLIGVAKRMIPRAPEGGESMIWEALGFLGMGAGVLALMTLGGGIAKRISGADIPGLAAIVADFSGFKYITGAIMGGLVTAAYAQPLTYYYNALFRPYLPKWEIALDLYNRGIIEEDELRFFAKYYGFPEKYVWHFIRFVATPISLIRQSDMIAWDTSNKGELLEEMRFFGLEEAGCIQFMPALWMKGKTTWLTRMITEMMYAIRRGFALVTEMVRDLESLVAGYEMVTSSGHRFLPGVTWRFKKMPETSEILEMIRRWSTIRLQGDGLANEILAEYREDLLTESEAKERLSKVIKISELVEGELAPIKARRVKKVEPEKGKDLRKELKSVLTDCYKEGLITKALLDKEVKGANLLVDEETLIFHRAEWEAFKDDMTDWVKIYVKSLEDGLITEDEFRKDLIDMGFRPAKVELLLEYDRAKKLGRIKKAEEKA